MPQETKLICFDIGGVVIRLCRTWAQGCAAAGVDVRDESLWQAAGPARQALLVQHQTGRMDGPTFAEQVSVLVGGLYSPAEILGVHRAWLLDEHEGIADLVDRLHEGGLDTAALSNTNHEHWSRMGEYPAVMRIRHHLPSHRLGLSKPDPSIYHRLERQLGYTPTEILFFDDAEENVRAAREIGWSAELIDPHAAPARQITAALRTYGLPC
ncbi:MAG: HAD-IA family hydrolase [Planctomycetota bacterium]|jgi:putative hydrolase of the HAD superfamily